MMLHSLKASINHKVLLQHRWEKLVEKLRLLKDAQKQSFLTKYMYDWCWNVKLKNDSKFTILSFIERLQNIQWKLFDNTQKFQTKELLC